MTITRQASPGAGPMTASEPLKVLDLFSGIGGFSLGLERAGMETIAFCEYDEPCRNVLKKRWPDIPIYEDVRNVTKERLNADGIFPDVITGGFPCQDISTAGKQAGIVEGTRSGLWSECARILGEFRPNYAIFENVTALLSGDNGRWFQRVLWDISQVGYDAEWHCIPASELGAHHHRDRVWVICYPNTSGGMERTEQAGQHEGAEIDTGICANVADPIGKRSTGRIFNKTDRCSGYGGREDAKIQWRGKNKEVSNNANLLKCERNQETRDAKEISTRLYKSIGRCINDKQSEGWAAEPDVGRVANGIPNRSHRLKQLGNSVVPQSPELIGRAIMVLDQ